MRNAGTRKATSILLFKDDSRFRLPTTQMKRIRFQYTVILALESSGVFQIRLCRNLLRLVRSRLGTVFNIGELDLLNEGRFLKKAARSSRR